MRKKGKSLTPWVTTPKSKCTCDASSYRDQTVCEMHLRAGYGKYYKARKGK